MGSVTQRIAHIKQPKGGYIKSSQFEKVVFDDDCILPSKENLDSFIVNKAVDYLSRFMSGSAVQDAFKVSLEGAKLAQSIGIRGSVAIAESLVEGVVGLDDKSIIFACKAVTYDVWLKDQLKAYMSNTDEQTLPDSDTIESIRIMVNRSLSFLEKYGPAVCRSFCFDGGYTETVDSGVGDLLTSDTLWEFKASKASPTSRNTLKLLMYYLMGKHSCLSMFESIENIGMYNPRLNTVHTLSLSLVSHDVISAVERDVLCY